MMWSLAMEAWSLTGEPLPDYPRHAAPVICFRRKASGHRVEQMDLPFLGREDLIRNKRATGRTKDLADLEILEAGPDD